MRIRPWHKTIATGFVLLLVLLSFFAALLSAMHVNHTCMDWETHCAQCVAIHALQRLLRRMLLLGLLLAGAHALAAPRPRHLPQRQSRPLGEVYTLISLRVRLNP